jgi:hypothetical protein
MERALGKFSHSGDFNMIQTRELQEPDYLGVNNLQVPDYSGVNILRVPNYSGLNNLQVPDKD